MRALDHPFVMNFSRIGPKTKLLGAATVVGGVIGWIGPFGTYLNDGFAVRAIYWIATMWIGFVLYGRAIEMASRFSVAGTWGRSLALVVAALLASIPMALVTRLLAYQLWPGLAGAGLSWSLWYGQTVTVGLMITAAVAWRLYRGPMETHDSSLPISGLQGNVIDRNVIALQMEDHYVRIHTPTGSRLALMTLRRAIESVEGTEGLKTHRSWWVARHAVAGVDGTARRMSLRLTNGVTAPVARSSVASLRAAGWIAQ